MPATSSTDSPQCPNFFGKFRLELLQTFYCCLFLKLLGWSKQCPDPVSDAAQKATPSTAPSEGDGVLLACRVGSFIATHISEKMQVECVGDEHLKLLPLTCTTSFVAQLLEATL